MELLPGPGGGLTKPGFDFLYAREHRRLWLLAAGLTGRAADADDVLQEALMLAFGKRAKFTPSANEAADGAAFCAWVGRFVRNVASNYTRRRQRQWKRRSEGVDPADVGREPSVQEEHATVQAAALSGTVPESQEAFDDRVSKALARIKPVWRTCLLMNVVGGLTQAEIAQALQMRENTVASHIRRGRERMRELLETSRPESPALGPGEQAEPTGLSAPKPLPSAAPEARKPAAGEAKPPETAAGAKFSFPAVRGHRH
jgi:RNA polymerase sigma-70 factor (ECF subfamily)